MDIARIVSELKKERDHLDSVIALLQKTGEAGDSSEETPSAGKTRRGGRKRHLTPQGRKRLSELMKKRWAERRKKNTSTRKQPPKAA